MLRRKPLEWEACEPGFYADHAEASEKLAIPRGRGPCPAVRFRRLPQRRSSSSMCSFRLGHHPPMSTPARNAVLPGSAVAAEERAARRQEDQILERYRRAFDYRLHHSPRYPTVEQPGLNPVTTGFDSRLSASLAKLMAHARGTQTGRRRSSNLRALWVRVPLAPSRTTTVRLCGAARSARHPGTVEVRGSNPSGTPPGPRGRSGAAAKASAVRLAPAPRFVVLRRLGIGEPSGP